MPSHTTVGSRELKTRLGTYLRQVREGARIIVTDRGRPIAQLTPLERADLNEEEGLAELVAMGILTAPSREGMKPFRGFPCRGDSLADAVAEEREDRF